jgi:C4-dicarboxylate transporter DctM subunit
MPIAFALTTAPTVYLLVTGKFPLDVLVQQMFNGVDSFVYLAVPFFILSGMLMTHGGISQRLIDFSSQLLNQLTGGLAMAVSLASMIFASLSGSGPATTAAIGGATLPALEEQGYGKEWSTALLAASGTIGPIIPPSITMVIYGGMAETSIGALFLAGIVPGIMVGLGLMVISYLHAKKVGVKTYSKRTNFSSIIKSFKNSIWAMGMPIIIIGGIMGGIFTPTEAAVISVVYALFICFFVYRSLKLKDLPQIFKQSIITTAVVMIIVANATSFSWLLTAEQGPQKLIMLFKQITANKYLILFMINFLLFVLGCFIDTTSALVMTVPTLLPLAQSIGVSSLHLGIIMCTNLVIGMATPPLGLTLFTACSISKVPISRIIRPIIPMLAIMFLVTLIITYIPQIALFLPELLMN